MVDAGRGEYAPEVCREYASAEPAVNTTAAPKRTRIALRIDQRGVQQRRSEQGLRRIDRRGVPQASRTEKQSLTRNSLQRYRARQGTTPGSAARAGHEAVEVRLTSRTACSPRSPGVGEDQTPSPSQRIGRQASSSSRRSAWAASREVEGCRMSPPKVALRPWNLCGKRHLAAPE